MVEGRRDLIAENGKKVDHQINQKRLVIDHEDFFSEARVLPVFFYSFFRNIDLSLR